MRHTLFSSLQALPGMSAAVPFMAVAVLLLPLIGIGLALIAGLLTSGNYRAFPVLAVNHLVTIGWGTLIAMGALHQMFPAMIGAPLRPGREAVAQFVLSFSGMTALVTGFLFRSTGLIVAGGAVAWSGVMWFLWVVLRLVPHRRRWSIPPTGVILALVYLGLAVTWGLLMGVNWRWGFWRGLLGYAGVGTHAALGVGGWFVQLIISVSYYLVPRFTGAERGRARRLRLILVLLNAGIAALVGAALGGGAPVARIGAALSGTAGLFYTGDGIHYMYASRNVFRENAFRDNMVGAAVMYSADVTLVANTFEGSRSIAAGAGLIFKDADRLQVLGNRIVRNRVGLEFDNTPASIGGWARVEGNFIAFNEIGLGLMSTAAITVTENTVVENLRPVAARGAVRADGNRWSVDGRGNYWGDYAGFDASGDGVGDIPYRRNDALEELSARAPVLQAFFHTPAHQALEAATRLVPFVSVAPVVEDRAPLMRPPAVAPGQASRTEGVEILWISTALLLPACVALTALRAPLKRP